MLQLEISFFVTLFFLFRHFLETVQKVVRAHHYEMAVVGGGRWWVVLAGAAASAGDGAEMC